MWKFLVQVWLGIEIFMKVLGLSGIWVLVILMVVIRFILLWLLVMFVLMWLMMVGQMIGWLLRNQVIFIGWFIIDLLLVISWLYWLLERVKWILNFWLLQSEIIILFMLINCLGFVDFDCIIVLNGVVKMVFFNWCLVFVSCYFNCLMVVFCWIILVFFSVNVFLVCFRFCWCWEISNL